MPAFSCVEPAIDPGARPTFLLDWELTLKCNLDCTYCATPTEVPLTEATHDNTSEHPDLDLCLKTIDFMYDYVDLYMRHKPRWTRSVVLNLYGGESLIHPDIVKILQQARIRHAPFAQKWPLTITCTTNAVIGHKRMQAVLPFIDEFTVSYHVESLKKQKTRVLDNLRLIQASHKKLKCILLMHGNQQYWPELLDVLDFCRDENIPYLARALDGATNASYNTHQINWFKNQYLDAVPQKSQKTQASAMQALDQCQNDSVALSEIGRACCGGRLMCQDTDLKHPIRFVPDNNFFGWQCSVNWFFLYVKQYTGEIFVNKDCRMSFDGTVSPIGYLNETDKLLTSTKLRLDTNTMPVIECRKSLCICGLCAPKARDKQTFKKIMVKHVDNVDRLL
jgi:pyruvate-formate lyase-activating enzyme